MGGRASVIMVLGFAAIFAMIQYRLSEIGTEAADNMIGYHEEMARHNVAVAGANLGLAVLYQNPTLRGVLADNVPYYGGTFNVRFDSIKTDTFRLRARGYYQGEEDTVIVYLSGKNKQTFSIFAYMTNIEGNIWWITGDTVWGQLHTNDRLQIYGSPVFMEKVTTVKGFYPAPGAGSNKAIFKDGYETGVAPKSFPSDISELKNAAQTGGYYSTTEVWIKLDPKSGGNNDGKVYVYNNAAMAPANLIDSVNISNPLFNGVFYSTQIVHMQGTLDGKLTVVSGNQIYLDDNVVYERPPVKGDPSATDDLLGIVSENNVYVTDNVPNTTSIEINGTIFTRMGSFTAQNYNTRPASGIIKLTGGLVQAQRGPVGTFSMGKIKTGFLKRYYFDERLGDPLVRPPLFPGYYSKTLRVVSWWE